MGKTRKEGGGGKDEEPTFMEQLEEFASERVKETTPEAEGPDDDTQDPPGKPEDREDGDREREPDAEEYGDEDDAGEDGDDDPEIDEALVERAVRAGLALADAKAIKSADALERIVVRLEGAGQSKEEGDEKPKKEGKDSAEMEIPDLNPDEYPEEFIKGWGVMKSIIASQRAEIKSLRDGANQGGSWIDAKIADLGKSYEEAFGKGTADSLKDQKHKANRAKLERHIQVAMDDAKDSGEKIGRAEAFKRALKSGFGEIETKEKGRVAREAAESRRAKAINRPRTTTGRFASETSTPQEREAEAIAAVAAMMEEA